MSEQTTRKQRLPCPDSVPAHLKPIWAEMAPQVSARIGAAGLEALCAQVYRLRDAEQRITKEGTVVVDGKGNAVPHPALAVEKAAGAEIRTWLKAFPPQRSL